jgi:cytokinin dehydrogenase
MISRRQVLTGLGAATVVGFNPLSRSWVSEAKAAELEGVPPLDGMLLTDPTSLAPYANDVGFIVHDTPVAVLLPGSVEDIAAMVRFCQEHRIKVAARGQGHTTFGQAQAEGGLIVDMSTLKQIHWVDATAAEVDAGLTWKELLETVVPQGLTPPALTGFTGLSIGGTLSVGGVSATNREGAQVDRVRELEVVTGTGEIVRCSAEHEPDLFEALLGGLGQCGIMTRAVVDLVPALPQARLYLLEYTDNASFFADFRLLLERGEFDRLYNIWLPKAGGGFVYQLNAIKYFDPAAPPDDAELLRNLAFEGEPTISDSTYLDHVLGVDYLVDFLKSIGLWDGFQRPWFDVFLSNEEIEDYVGAVLPTLTPEDQGPTGFLLLFALKRSELRRPMLRVPSDTDWVFLFDILTAAATPGSDPDFSERMLARNRELFEQAREIGGTRYPISAIPFERGDWARHYDEQWARLVRLKHRFDPAKILAPGPGVFDAQR